MGRGTASDGVEAGVLGGGMAYLATGTGEPLVVLSGLTASNAPPTGAERKRTVQEIRPFAHDRRVWWINRPPGLARGTTMADLAADTAAVLRATFPGPVDVIGASTGGVLALQLAVDHPDVVRQLVLRAAACRLSDTGKAGQARIAALVRAGHGRRAMAATGAMATARAWTRPLVGGLVALAPVPDDLSDMLVTLEAEDAVDLEPRLGEVRAPVLVVGGDRDRFYGDLLARTSELLPDARLVLLPGVGHFGAFTDRRVTAAIEEFLGPSAA